MQWRGLLDAILPCTVCPLGTMSYGISVLQSFRSGVSGIPWPLSVLFGAIYLYETATGGIFTSWYEQLCGFYSPSAYPRLSHSLHLGGVFLLLGYSSTDEALLRPHTNLGVQDAVRALQHYVLKHIDNQTSCSLTLFNITDENIILSVRLPHDPKINPIELLRLEKVST